ncbi:hypothetical protein AB0E55_37465 [Amycolatopsis keratiniphila]|uniref:hypothetical protein n=1 Tax=Amycolatopsis keratiniphila TaxID=129921 RepID=UPI0034038313
MESLREQFTNPAWAQKVIVHVTLTDAVTLKTLTGDANWLPTIAWFFDQVGESVERQGGDVSKYLNDGVVAAFPIDRAAEAINAAILVQERINEAQRENSYRCNCAIGVATGRAVQFPGGAAPTFIGPVADRAERLSDGANAGAIFVDEATVGAANMMMVFSTYGNVINREGSQYLAALEELPAEGAGVRIAYHEILWAAQSFGVRSRAVTKINTVASATAAPPAQPSERIAWQRGTVSTWLEDRGIGFLAGQNGDTYYLHEDNLCPGTGKPTRGDTVFFIGQPAHGHGRHPRALCALPMGAELTVTLTKVFAAFGFCVLSDARGTRQELFLDLGHGAQDRYRTGQELTVRIDENRRGPAGLVLDSTVTELSA